MTDPPDGDGYAIERDDADAGSRPVASTAGHEEQEPRDESAGQAGQQDDSPERDPEYESAIRRKRASFAMAASAWYFSQARYNDLPRSRDRYARYLEQTYAAFENHEGSVLASFYCERFPAAVALTARTPSRRRSSTETYAIHILNGAPRGIERDAAGVAALDLIARCDRVSTDASEHLTGAAQRTCIDIIYGVVTDLLFALEEAADRLGVDPGAQATTGRSPGALRKPGPDDPPGMELVRQAETRLEEAADYLSTRASRAGQMRFLTGMASSFPLVLLAGWLLLWLPFDAPLRRLLFAGCLAGATGAAVSVLQRLRGRGLEVDWQAGSTQLRVTGAVRPFLGAVAGVLLFLAVRGGYLPLAEPAEPDARFAFFAVAAFFAGSSERWIDDMLYGIGEKLDASPQKVGSRDRRRRRSPTDRSRDQEASPSRRRAGVSDDQEESTPHRPAKRRGGAGAGGRRSPQ